MPNGTYERIKKFYDTLPLNSLKLVFAGQKSSVLEYCSIVRNENIKYIWIFFQWCCCHENRLHHICLLDWASLYSMEINNEIFPKSCHWNWNYLYMGHLLFPIHIVSSFCCRHCANIVVVIGLSWKYFCEAIPLTSFWKIKGIIRISVTRLPPPSNFPSKIAIHLMISFTRSNCPIDTCC